MTKKKDTRPRNYPANSIRGMRARVAFDDMGIVRPMAVIDAVAPKLTEEERQMIRHFLCGGAGKGMPERLMRIAEKALKMRPVKTA